MKRTNNFGKIIVIIAILTGAFSLALMILNSIRQRNNQYITVDPDTMKLVQLEAPKDGDPIAIVETTLGEIRFVLYPQYSPNAVKNFTELAESGYYDDTYVYDAQSGAYSGMGTKNKNGSVEGGYDVPKEKVERELSQDLWPFRGAVCMVNTTIDRSFWQMIVGGGTYYCGSRFDILNSIAFTDEISEEMRSSSVGEALAEAFISKGGIPNFSQQMTIIGQTYEGFDVVDELASLKSHQSGDFMTPDEDVKVISVTIGEYSSEEEAEKTEQAEK